MNGDGLRRAAVYNPSLWSDEELGQYFVVRTDLLDRILGDLRQERAGQPPQHRLILGLRGMGKTTLLRRLALAIRQDGELGRIWLPLTFPEEQYNVATPADLWLNCIDALSDVLEDMGEFECAESLDEKIENLPENDADGALEILVGMSAKLKKRFVLLIDNIDLILDRLKHIEWSIRETLQSEPNLMFIGASSRAVEATYEYDAAFYDFFKIDELGSLDRHETHRVLKTLARIEKADQVIDVLKSDPARIDTLHTLTGGNPRTVVLLFKVLTQGLEGDVRSDFEALLDMVTPLYKSRFEELPTLSQQVVDALALNWDPIGAGPLAKRLGLQVNKVSAQLARLENQALVEKTAPVQGKRALFQISERFFNIWYLMRASRRVRRKLIWLVQFLRLFFSARELRLHARQQLQAKAVFGQRSAEYLLALAQAIDVPTMRGALESQALQALLDDEKYESSINHIFDLKGEDSKLLSKVDHLKQIRDAKKKIKDSISKTSIDVENFVFQLLGSPSASLRQKIFFSNKSESMSIDCLKDKSIRLNKEWNIQLRIYGKDAEALYKAISTGEMQNAGDIKGAASADERFGVPKLTLIAWHNHLASSDHDLSPEEVQTAQNACDEAETKYEEMVWPKIFRANLLARHLDQAELAEASIRKAIEIHPSCGYAWGQLGLLLTDILDRHEDAEVAFRKAVEINSDSADDWICLGIVLSDKLGRHDEAERAYRKAIEVDPESAVCWSILGVLLTDKLARPEEAATALRKAIELDPAAIYARVKLGLHLMVVLEREREAELVFRQAADVAPDSAITWQCLGTALMDKPECRDEAEEAFRKAIKLEPKSILGWSNLGIFLSTEADRHAEAEMAFRKAIDASPNHAFVWRALGKLLSEDSERHEEAESAFRKAIEINDNSADNWRQLGRLLALVPDQRREAEEALRRAIEIGPEHYSDWSSIGTLLSVIPERREEAESAIRKAIEINPNSAANWTGLGALLTYIPERHEEAKVALKKAIDINPGIAVAWANIGMLLAGNKETDDEAEAALRKAIELNPNLALAQTYIGVLLTADPKRHNEAEAALRKAIQLEPKSAYAWISLGRLVKQMPGYQYEAEMAFRKAIKFDPLDGTYLNSLAWHLFEQKKALNESIELARKAVELDPRDLCSIHTLAMALVRAGQWEEAEPWIRNFVGESVDNFSDDIWSDVILLFHEIVGKGCIKTAIEILETSGVNERWRPLKEALDTIASGSLQHLNGVAPEVRKPAIEIVEQLSPGFPD